MEYKILNFPEALKIASILAKHVDVQEARGMEGWELSSKIFSSISSDEVAIVARAFLGDFRQMNSEEILKLCTDIMERNNILDLLEAYTVMGFSQ